MAQSPKTSQGGASLSNKVRSQPPAWQWRWKQSPIPSARLPQEVTVRPLMPLFSQIQWACYKKCRKVEWEAQTGMCQWSTPTFENSRRCTALSIPEWKETTEEIDWRAKHAIIKSGLHLGRSEVLRSLRHYLRAQSQGHHTINRLQETGVERGSASRSSLETGVERGSASRSSLKGRERAIINQMNIGTVSKETLGNFRETWWRPYMGFSERIDNFLTWTELELTSSSLT